MTVSPRWRGRWPETTAIALVTVAVLLAGWSPAGPRDAAGPPRQVRGEIRGVDVSGLPAREAAGAVYRDGDRVGDALTLLRGHGADAVRLRLWHTPAGTTGSLQATLALARRAAALGMTILLDLHYSDTWADPGHQRPPAAWSGLDLPALCDSVASWTGGVLDALSAQGTPPAVVQIGNEIDAGLLWDTGRVGGEFDTPRQWDALARLLATAAAAVRGRPPRGDRPAVMLHLAGSGDADWCARFLDRLAARGVSWDLVGLSYYPWWHGGLDDLARTLRLLARRGQPVVVVETAYPWTLAWYDDRHNVVGRADQLLPGFPASPRGQRDYLARLWRLVRSLPGGLGRGVVWWSPEAVSLPGCPSSWENLTLFDHAGHLLPAASAMAP